MDALIVFFLFNYFFIVLAIVIGLIAVEWILFERAGEPGWKVLVPFYGSFIMHKITFGEESKWYWFLILVPGYSFYMQYSFTSSKSMSICWHSSWNDPLPDVAPLICTVFSAVAQSCFNPRVYSYRCSST